MTKKISKRPTRKKFMKQRWVIAIEHYLRGEKQSDCMRAAGYAESVCATAANKFFARQDIRDEIERRRAGIRTRTQVVIDRVQEELMRIAFFNLGKIMEVTEDGDLIFNFEDVTLEDMAAIGEVTVETYKEGRGVNAKDVKRVRVKPNNKQSALDALARIHGMFQDNLNMTGTGASLEERLQAGRKRLAQPVIVEGECEDVSEE